jgi:transcriptional regulator with XRE-family HTH domain
MIIYWTHNRKNDMTKLKKILKEKELTQEEFAERIGLKQSNVSFIIAGKRPMPPERAFKAEQECGIPCELLVPWLGDLKKMAVEKALAQDGKQ